MHDLNEISIFVTQAIISGTIGNAYYDVLKFTLGKFGNELKKSAYTKDFDSLEKRITKLLKQNPELFQEIGKIYSEYNELLEKGKQSRKELDQNPINKMTNSDKLDDERIIFIEDLVNNIINRYNVTEPPIPIFDIVTNEGLVIKYGTMSDPAVQGMYVKEKKLILVSKDTSQKRINFTIAHEFGHYILLETMQFDIFYLLSKEIKVTKEDKIIFIDINKHTYKYEKSDLFFRQELPNSKKSFTEYEANYFASALLAPEIIVKQTIKDLFKRRHIDITILSGVFDVNIDLMHFRLKNLKLI